MDEGNPSCPRGKKWRYARDNVSTTGDGALAGLAVPDTDSVSADGDLAAESAGVLGVLGDFHLLHLLTQGGTVTVSELELVFHALVEIRRPDG